MHEYVVSERKAKRWIGACTPCPCTEGEQILAGQNRNLRAHCLCRLHVTQLPLLYSLPGEVTTFP